MAENVTDERGDAVDRPHAKCGEAEEEPSLEMPFGPVRLSAPRIVSKSAER